MVARYGHKIHSIIGEHKHLIGIFRIIMHMKTN